MIPADPSSKKSALEYRHMNIRTILALRIAAAALALIPVAGCTQEAKTKRTLSRADNYFKAGEYEKAKIEYLNVMKGDPQNKVAIRQLGLIWTEQGSPLRAGPYLVKTRELEPANLDVRLKLAQALAALGQAADARKEALAILEKRPGQEDAIVILMDTSRTPEEVEETERLIQTTARPGSALPHLSAANAAARKQDLDAVQAALDKALAADPKSPQAHVGQANLYLLRRKLDEAETEYKVASELAPVRSIARLRLGEFFAQRGKAAEAAAWIDGVTKVAPDYIPAWIGRARIALVEKKFDELLGHLQKVFAIDGQNLEGRLLEGQALIAKNEIPKAVDSLETLAKAFPNAPVVKFQLARAYLGASKPTDAITALNQAIALSPDYVEAILLLGELDLKSGDTDAVEGAMIGLLKKQPELAQAQLLLAEAYRSAGKLAQAAAIHEQRLKALPNDTASRLLLGIVLRQQGKLTEAREAFAKAEELVPDSLLPLSQLVDMDLGEKPPNFDAALKKVEARIAKNPDLAGAWFLKGRIYATQSSWDNAEVAVQKAIELDPNFVGAYDLLAVVYYSAGKVDKSIEQLNELVAKDSNNTRALMMLGVMHAQLKQMDKAQNAYEKAIAVKPDFAPALNNLAWVYSENANQPDKALETARKARSLQPSSPEVADTYGWILYRRGEYQQSLALFREAVAQLADNPEVNYHLGMAAYMMGDKELARKRLQVAADSKQDFPGKDQIASRLALLPQPGQQQPPLSPDDLKKLLETQPQDTVAWVRLGEIYEEQKTPDKAASAYQSALQVNPKLLPAMLRLAALNVDQLHNPSKALELARSARDLAPNDPAVAGSVGHIALKGGNHVWALSLLQDGVRGNPQNPVVLRDFALAAYALGRVKEACDSMQKVVALPGDNSAAEEARRFLRFVTPDGSVPKVPAEEVEATLKSTPGYLPALMARGASQEQGGNAKDAIATYNEILKTYPSFAPAQKRLAGLYVDTPENRDKAYSLAVEARKTLPDDTELTRTLAAISYQRGEFPYVVQLLDTSAKASPLGVKDNFYLGMARYKTKASPRTIQEALQASVDAGLGEPMAKEANRVLAELQGSK
jgi:tetratricopeptide (TPR) repeat protein